MTRYVRGDMLAYSVQQHALRLFVNRFTRTNRPKWANEPTSNGLPYPVQFESDDEWLANSRFAVTKQGHLDRRTKECISRPTWPDNPELRKPDLPPIPIDSDWE